MKLGVTIYQENKMMKIKVSLTHFVFPNLNISMYK
jgi:hypothetical protein